MPYQMIANIITAINSLAGLVAIFLAVHDEYVLSAALIVAAVFLDAIDGKIARLDHKKTPSDFGKEFDSLSDLISFGVAPAVLLYSLINGTADIFAIACLCVYVLAGVFRLARFNVYSRQKQPPYFLGCPIPAAAGVIAGVVLFLLKYNSLDINPTFILLGCLVLAGLMASRIRYPNSSLLSGMGWPKLLVTGAAVLMLLVFLPQLFIFGSFLAYLVISPFVFAKMPKWR